MKEGGKEARKRRTATSSGRGKRCSRCNFEDMKNAQGKLGKPMWEEGDFLDVGEKEGKREREREGRRGARREPRESERGREGEVNGEKSGSQRPAERSRTMAMALKAQYSSPLGPHQTIPSHPIPHQTIPHHPIPFQTR